MKINRYVHIFLFIGIVLFLSAYMVYWGTQKEGYHLDEMFSMLRINDYEWSFPYWGDDFFNTWHNASELESTIGVKAENAFSEIGKYRSLHNTLLHIAYSFNPGEFSLWPSMAVNIITLTGCLIVIYLLSLMFINNKYLALLPGFLWGLSSAAANMVIFIRYCSFLTFFSLLLTYVVFDALRNNFSKWRYPVVIAVTTLLGTYIHQYFFVYAFFLTAIVCFYLLLKAIKEKRIKQLVIFVAAILSAIAINQIDTNRITRVITAPMGLAEGGREGEAVENLIFGNAGWGGRIQAFSSIISNELFAGISLIVILMACIVLMLLISVANTERGAGIADDIKRKLKNQKVLFWLIGSSVCMLYLLMIARIAPYQDLRYVFNVTPMIVILFVSLGVNALTSVGFKNTVSVFLIVFVLYSAMFAGRVTGYYFYKELKDVDETLSEYYNLPVISISATTYDQATFYWQLFSFQNDVLFATIGDVDYDAISRHGHDDGVLLMLHYASDGTEMERIMEDLGLEHKELVVNLVRHAVYVLK